MKQVQLIAPDDFHLHVRQGRMLRKVLPHSARHFRRGLIMPNTDPPVLTAEDAVQYRLKIMGVLPEPGNFEPLMTLYLTTETTPRMIRDAKEAGVVAVKFYPKDSTTGSGHGVRIQELSKLGDTFREMERLGIVLCLHGEDPSVSSLKREAAFLPMLHLLGENFRRLKIVLEHISTAEAVRAVLCLPDNVAATVTAHHLAATIDDLMGGLLNPHLHCKPCLKEPEHREALWEVIRSGNPKFFFGSDSAPHPVETKESARGCGGVYSAPVALPLLAQLFDERNLLHRLCDYTSRFGAAFYGLPHNDGFINLQQEPWIVPQRFDDVVPLWAGREITWQVVS